MRFFLAILLTTALFFSFQQCTNNPFDNDSIAASTNKISGKVILDDARSPEIIHVWLEGFDLSTHPDEQGNFQIQLSAPSLQPYGGLTGAYKIFFFLANYELDSATVVVKNGLLMTSRGDIDENGHLRQLKILTKTLRISLSVSPDSLEYNSTAGLSFELRLEATADTVFVHYPDRATGPLAVLFFKNLSDEKQPVKVFENSYFASAAPIVTDSVSTNPKFWYAGARFQTIGLSKGRYEVIPFFIIDHSKVPPELLNNIGALIDKPTLDFLRVPTYRDGGNFTVTGPGTK